MKLLALGDGAGAVSGIGGIPGIGGMSGFGGISFMTMPLGIGLVPCVTFMSLGIGLMPLLPFISLAPGRTPILGTGRWPSPTAVQTMIRTAKHAASNTADVIREPICVKSFDNRKI